MLNPLFGIKNIFIEHLLWWRAGIKKRKVHLGVELHLSFFGRILIFILWLNLQNDRGHLKGAIILLCHSFHIMWLKTWPLTSWSICITVNLRVVLGRLADDSPYSKPYITQRKKWHNGEKKSNPSMWFFKRSDQHGTKKKSIVSFLQNDEDLDLQNRWFRHLRSRGKSTGWRNISCAVARMSRCNKAENRCSKFCWHSTEGDRLRKCYVVFPTGLHPWESVSEHL